jgi:carbon storage regulator
MLVLSRKINETIVIGGNIRVTMTAIHSRQVRLAIDAPRDVPIIRQELLSTPPKVELDHGRAAGLPVRADRDRVRRIRGVRPGR